MGWERGTGDADSPFCIIGQEAGCCLGFSDCHCDFDGGVQVYGVNNAI